MTNQSQPLTLKLSTGQEVSIAEAKSVLRHTSNGHQSRCAIVRGPQGVAIYNAEGDVQINGAPSSAHWLQQGDTLEFGDGFSALVEQLGVTEQAINSLVNEEDQVTSVAQVDATPIPAETTSPDPVSSTTQNDQETFKPATAAVGFDAEQPQVATPTEPTPIEPAAPATAVDLRETAAQVAVPVAATSALAAAGIMRAALSSAPDETAVTPTAQVEATLPTPATPEVAEEAVTDLPTTGFAAELLARIQADDNNEQQNKNETVGSPISETTHSPLAADGSSFSSPASEPTSISSVIPELPSTSALTSEAPSPEAQPESLETAAAVSVETTTAESAERQTQSNSATALLERMKNEGQWEGISEQEEAAEAEVEGAAPEDPVQTEAENDVQSYMSQLLSRMRDPNDKSPQPVAASAAVKTPKAVEPKVEVVEAPKPISLLKPEEYVPKNKARRLDSLQDMRALANTQTRTAIDRSQAKRHEATMGNFNLVVAVVSGIVAAIAMAANYCGYLTFATAVSVATISIICGAFYCCKTFYSELLESNNQDEAVATQETPEEFQEAV